MQTLLNSIPALIGLAGVCLTLLWNARSQRSAREWERQSEQMSLAAAILAELQSNRRLLRPYSTMIRQYHPHVAHGPRLKELKFPSRLTTAIFDSNVAKLGLLESKTIEKTAFAYSHLKMFDAYLATLSGQGHGSAPSASARPTVPLRNKDTALELRIWIEECITRIDDAVVRLTPEV